jgi:hypothetical protein
MTAADYRAMASEIRDLIPLLLHSQSVSDLRLLADRYDRLAHSLAVGKQRTGFSNSGAKRADIHYCRRIHR